MRAIFISYRRDDAEGQAGRLFDDLVRQFGQNAVFMDVTGIEPGRDFRRVIDDHVASCGVLLAVIGKTWLDAKDQSGARRLDDPSDFVRLETASALKRDIPVVPVLVQGAKMPGAEQLPDVLKDLAYRNAVELTHARWDSDVDVLAKQLQRHVDPDPKRAAGASASSGMSKRIAIGVALSAVAVVAGWYFWSSPRGSVADDVAVDASKAQPLAPADAKPAPAQEPRSLQVARHPDAIAPGTMLLYRFRGIADGSADWAVTGKKIGEGWSFKQVFAGDNGAIYAIQDNGDLLFYRFRKIVDGAPDWAVTNKKIGEGWNFKQVFAGDGGAIYAIQDNGDLLFYRFRGVADGSADWAVQSKKIGEGWHYKHVFAGENGGIFAIKDNGDMFFYRFRGVADGSADWAVRSKQVGNGWNFKQVFAGDGGAIYAIQDNGDVLFYRFHGIVDGDPAWAVQSKKIAEGWNFKHAFAGDGGVIYAIQ